VQELEQMAVLARATGDTKAPYELAMSRGLALLNSARMTDALKLTRWVVHEAPSPDLVARGRVLIGIASMFLGDDAGARVELERALALDALPRSKPLILAYLCHLAVSAGRLGDAEEHFERALGVADTLASPLMRLQALHAGYRVPEAAGDRSLAIARLEEALALSVDAGDVGHRLPILHNLIGVLLNAGDFAGARARRAAMEPLLAGKSDPKSRFLDQMTTAQLRVAAGDLGAAWSAYGEALAAGHAGDDRSMRRAVLAGRGQLAADAGCAAVVAAVVAELRGDAPMHGPGLLDLVLEARHALAVGDFDGAVEQARQALASTAPDPDRQELVESARATLGAALGALGDAEGARHTVAPIRFSPRLQASRLEVLLDVGGDEPDRDQALALVDRGTLTPLESLRLGESLAGWSGRRGNDREEAFWRSSANVARTTLAASLRGEDASLDRLAEALLRPISPS
jgi:tetratricopeptide (TPR) repeat protein